MHLFCKMVGFSSLTEFTVYLTLNHKQISDWILFLLIFFFAFLDSCKSFGTAVLLSRVGGRGWGVWGGGRGVVAFTV